MALLSVRPSMVSTEAPSACTASVRQLRTDRPSIKTLQAPHTPCSQPTWVPVSRSVWRRKSARFSRASTMTLTGLPLSIKLMSWRSDMSGPRGHVLQRALQQHGRLPPLGLTAALMAVDGIHVFCDAVRNLGQRIIRHTFIDGELARRWAEQRRGFGTEEHHIELVQTTWRFACPHRNTDGCEITVTAAQL